MDAGGERGGIASDATCQAYHQVAATMRNVPLPACHFRSTSWNNGICHCHHPAPGTVEPPSPPPPAPWYSCEWIHLSFASVGGLLVGLLLFPLFAGLAKRRRGREAYERTGDPLRLAEPLHAPEPTQALAAVGSIQHVPAGAPGV